MIPGVKEKTLFGTDLMTNYYYAGTSYDFFTLDSIIALFYPWDFNNTAWVILLIVYYWVKYNEKYIYKGPNYLDLDR